MFAILLAATAALYYHGDQLLAALVWVSAISTLHAVEETRGSLWRYFAEIANFDLLKKVNPVAGFAIAVASAYLIQLGVAYAAFHGPLVQPHWLALLIGLRLGDGFCSHIFLFANGYEPIRRGNDEPVQRNPGLPTGFLYVLDALVLMVIFRPELVSDPSNLLFGIAGALFFASVLPTFKILG